jgi:hypothetical protein
MSTLTIRLPDDRHVMSQPRRVASDKQGATLRALGIKPQDLGG